ncbi:MAG: CoA-binding protein [Bacillota bacterium]
MYTDQELKDIMEEMRTIAIVGISDKEDRPSYRVAKYLQDQGYRIIPVNPRLQEVLGEKAYPDLKSIPEPVDVVDVFRKPEEVVPVAREAVEIGAKVLWLQLGIQNEEAEKLAAAAGLKTVADRCLKIEHARLMERG